jgi:hypothetical protein
VTVPRWAEVVAAMALLTLFAFVLTRGDFDRWIP